MSVHVCAVVALVLFIWILSTRELILALLKASVLSVEPMVLMELRLRSSVSSSMTVLVSLVGAVVAGCVPISVAMTELVGVLKSTDR